MINIIRDNIKNLDSPVISRNIENHIHGATGLTGRCEVLKEPPRRGRATDPLFCVISVTNQFEHIFFSWKSTKESRHYPSPQMPLQAQSSSQIPPNFHEIPLRGGTCLEPKSLEVLDHSVATEIVQIICWNLLECLCRSPKLAFNQIRKHIDSLFGCCGYSSLVKRG